MNESLGLILLCWMGIGTVWFIYVGIVCVVKKGRVREGTLLGCCWFWPLTFGGYIYRLTTGKRNQYDPLDLTDFGS